MYQNLVEFLYSHCLYISGTRRVTRGGPFRKQQQFRHLLEPQRVVSLARFGSK